MSSAKITTTLGFGAAAAAARDAKHAATTASRRITWRSRNDFMRVSRFSG